MKKNLFVVCLLLVSLTAFSQSIDPSKLDLSSAKMAVAGPDEVYVTNIDYDGSILSVLLKFDGGYGAIIYGPWFSKDKLLQDNYELGYASIDAFGTDTLIISNVILGEKAYAGRLTFDGVSKLTLQNFWQITDPVTPDAQIASLERRLAAQEAKYTADAEAAQVVHDSKIAEMQASLDEAIKAAKAAGVATAQLEAMVSKPGRFVASGFTGGRVESGDWTITSRGAAQTDPSEYFAKYVIPVSQRSSEMLYSIEGKADKSGYVGYGLHFMASGDRQGDKYGFGTSYLVWLTRDPGYYGTEATYLQAYGSFDDVTMIQVGSLAIAADIGMNNTTDVLYNSRTGRVSISVNGTEYMSFIIPAMYRISSGSKVALRALGAVTFSDLTVMAD
jgi:hypothetical protein